MLRNLCCAAVLLAATLARAADFPSRPIRLVVPNPAGGTVDIVARTLAQQLSAPLGQNVIVEVKPGANTIIGTEMVARAPADGHTLVMVGTPFALNPLLRPMPYDAHRDFIPVARLASLPFVVAVHPSVAANSLGDLIALAKARPGQLSYATFGLGQLIGEHLKSLAHIDMTLVSFQGGVQATLSVAGGHAGVLVGPLSDALPHARSGKLNVLAVTSAQREQAVKSVPTVAESGYPGFEWMSWIGAAAPAGTPAGTIERLGAAMLAAARSEQTRAVLEPLNVVPAALEGPAFGAFIRSEMQRYDAVVKQAGIKAD